VIHAIHGVDGRIGRAGNVGYMSIWCDIIKEMDRMLRSGIESEQWGHLLDSLEGVMLNPLEDSGRQGQGRGRGCGSYGGGDNEQGHAPSQPHSLGRGNDHQHRPSTMHAPVQPQGPMQYCPAQSMPPSHGMGLSMPPSHGVDPGRGVQPVAVVPTDVRRNLSIRTSTRVASVPEAVSLPLVPSSSKLIKPPARPGFGTVGWKVMITANL
nr:hypothetical protein [Tanacetum cinerariifolium]